MAKEVINGVRVWASEIDENTRLQAERQARSPVVSGPIALMPDAHVGLGSPIGSVIPTEGAIIPAAVGVDIGCGMIAVQTNLRAEDLPDSLACGQRGLWRVAEFLRKVESPVAARPLGLSREVLT